MSMRQPCSKIVTSHVDNVVSYGYNCYRGTTSTSNNATIHAEHSAINKLKSLEKGKKLVRINILVIKISLAGLISMSKPCQHCIDILQLLANKKGYYISNIYFSNNLRNIEKWSYTELENDKSKHVTEFYKNSAFRNKK